MVFLLAEMRTCAQCEVEKALTEYHLKSGVKGGKRYEWRERTCVECRRLQHKAWREANPEKTHAWHRRKVVQQYGLTVEQYDDMLEEQGGVCAVCGGGTGVGCTKQQPMARLQGSQSRPRTRPVSWSWSTGRYMANDPDRLVAAAAYLLKEQG